MRRIVGRSFVLVVLAATAVSASASASPTGQPVPSVRGTPRAGVALTRIYRAQDGGFLYLRQLGSDVYGFGEHPSGSYAYVLVGRVTGDRIDGSWWDVPKGALRKVNKGVLALRWSLNGARIDRSGGDDLGPRTFIAVQPTGISWPNLRAAGFQSTTSADLDGAFVGDDGSRHYVRETSFNTVWVGERASQPGERPGWVTVFAGKRKGTGFSGTYVDVPKGVELRSGSFGAALVGTTRTLFLSQVGATRTKQLAPDYAIDWDGFVNGVAKEIDGRVVGEAFALAHSGAIIRSHAWGFRRHAIDGNPLPFTTKTQAQTASAAKLISATAIIKALRDRGLDVDARAAPFLPSCIKQGPGVSTLTFREILSHKTGLRGARGFDKEESCNGRDPYDCLLDVLAKGRIYDRTYAYNNKAYDLLRFLVPLVSDSSRTKADFTQFNCKNSGNVLHRRIAERFARYVQDQVLKPVGSNGNWYPSGDYSLNYNCYIKLTDAACSPDHKGEAMTPEYFLRSGSGKMAMSALDYVRFLSALDRGLIVPKSVVESMKEGRLGFDTVISGKLGSYFWKDGGCPSLDKPAWRRGCQTLAIVFPGDFQAYVAINSKDNNFSPNIKKVFRNGFDAALK
jgi:CubicO group peptidase (beta-lactamase class C family)